MILINHIQEKINKKADVALTEEIRKLKLDFDFFSTLRRNQNLDINHPVCMMIDISRKCENKNGVIRISAEAFISIMRDQFKEKYKDANRNEFTSEFISKVNSLQEQIDDLQDNF